MSVTGAAEGQPNWSRAQLSLLAAAIIHSGDIAVTLVRASDVWVANQLWEQVRRQPVDVEETAASSALIREVARRLDTGASRDGTRSVRTRSARGQRVELSQTS